MCAVCAQPLCCRLHSMESIVQHSSHLTVTMYSCVCSFVSTKSFPLNQPNTLCHTSLSHAHLPLCIALIPTAHSPHTTHVLHVWYFGTFMLHVCSDIGVGTMGARGPCPPPPPPRFHKGGTGPHRLLALSHLCNL